MLWPPRPARLIFVLINKRLAIATKRADLRIGRSDEIQSNYRKHILSVTAGSIALDQLATENDQAEEGVRYEALEGALSSSNVATVLVKEYAQIK